MPKEFVSKWEDAATNLDIIYAIGEEGNSKDEIRKEMNALEALMSGFVMNQKDELDD